MKYSIILLIFIILSTIAVAETMLEQSIQRLDIDLLKEQLLTQSCEENLQLKSLNPIEFRRYKANCLVVLYKTSTEETGLVVLLPISSFFPSSDRQYDVSRSQKGKGFIFGYSKK